MIIPGVVGRIAESTQPSAADAASEALAALTDNGKASTISAPGITTAAVSGWTVQEDGITCAIAGNLDWLDYAFADIQLKRGPAHALMQAYRKAGKDLLKALGGRFVFVIWDSNTQTAIVACDRFCQMPLYWAEDDVGGLVFGPTATAVNQLLGARGSLSEQAIFNYLYFHMVPGPRTVFQGVNKLMAAHALIRQNGVWRPIRYWEPDFRERDDAPIGEAAEELLGLLGSAVAKQAKGADTGAFLSGGLDSSTVSGLLAKHQPNPKTYSIGFDAEGYDEIAFAKLASDRFGTDFKTYYVTPADVLEALPKIADAYDEPFGNSSALPAYFCARFAASDGRQRLLAGDGGDELFAGNERYQKQSVFERYGILPGWARRGVLEPLVCKVAPDSLPLIGKARSYIEQANIPLPDRLQTYNFLNRLGAQTIVHEALWHSIDGDTPLELDRDLYGHPQGATRLNRMLYLDWHHTLADNDLRKVNRMCQLAGIDVEYPMLNDRVVEFSTRVSSSRKMRGNRLRDFYKKAVADFLPGEIIDKPKHGFGLPFGVWMAEHPGLQELAADNLERMKRRRYVKAEFIDEIMRLHRDQHAGYYGEFIWVLIMLELWLTAQGYEP